MFRCKDEKSGIIQIESQDGSSSHAKCCKKIISLESKMQKMEEAQDQLKKEFDILKDNQTSFD